MIDPRAISELLDAEPFERFRIYMNDGHVYEVDNPGLLVPMQTKLFIALPGDSWKFLSYQNITRIESSEMAK